MDRALRARHRPASSAPLRTRPRRRLPARAHFREHGYLERQRSQAARPGILFATALAADLNQRVPSPVLPPHHVPMHPAALDVLIAHQLQGTPVLVAAELAGHPGLDERLPHTPDGQIVRPAALVLTEPALCLYAASGAARVQLVEQLAAASWPARTRGLLLDDDERPITAIPGSYLRAYNPARGPRDRRQPRRRLPLIHRPRTAHHATRSALLAS